MELKYLIDYLLEHKLNVWKNPDANGELISEHILGVYTVKILSKIPDDFPLTLPKFHLCERYKYGALAHVAWGDNGYADICYGADSYNIDYSRPEFIYLSALKKVLSILDKSLNDQYYNKKELLREFVGVWRFHIPDVAPVLTCLIEPTKDFIHDLIIKVPSNKKINDKVKNLGINAFLNQCNPNHLFMKELKSKGRLIEGKGILLSLPELPLPPKPNESIISWWKNLVSTFPATLQSTLLEKGRLTKTKQLYIVCHAKNENENVWFAIECSNTKKEHVPIHQKYLNNWNLRAITLEIVSKENLLSRIGVDNLLTNKKVCLIGCGSVGGYIADMLASSGIGEIHIVDPDVFTLENLHRHYLGASAIGTFKVDALKRFLEYKYPFIKIKSSKNKLLDYCSEEKLTDFDLVICASGNITHERKINDFIVKNRINIPITFSWVEAYGVGGHAIAVLPNSKGCLNCVFIDNESSEFSLYPNINFIQKDQNIKKSHAGCGTEFIAYSNIDAIQTATITSQVVLKILSSQLSESSFISWRGDKELAIKNDIELSHRFYRFKNIMQLIPLVREECNDC